MEALPPPTAGSAQAEAEAEERKKVKEKRKKRLTLIPLAFLIFFEVSGGPYGEEPAVQAAGPLLAILGFLLFPFIWSLPEALVTAELATAFPSDAGYVLWASAAFGAFPAHLMASWKLLSGLVNAAAYPALCSDYLARAVPALGRGGAPRALANVGFTLALSFLNYLGLAVVGVGGVALGILALLPFVAMAGWAAPKLRPRRWEAGVGGDGRRDWGLYVNTLFWNLNFWDNASTLAGEVDDAGKTYPRALVLAGVVTCIGYIVPLLAGVGALDVPASSWEDGFLADAGGMIAGNWLKYWVQAGSVLSSVGLYEAQLSSCAYQLLGMAELGLVPKFFALRSKWFQTPWLAIVVSTAVALGLSFLSFNDIISAANFIYSLSMLLEFAAFLWLRHKLPDQHRPFRVPLRLPGLAVMCFIPSVFIVIVMVLGNWKVYTIGFGLTGVGVATYFANGWFKKKSWIKFADEDTVKAAMDFSAHDRRSGEA